MQDLSFSAITVACIGILVPAAYTLFVIFLTKRGKELAKMEGFFSSISQLNKALHAAFMERQKSSNRP